MSKKGHIITLANIKGGVGKTTAVVNLAYLMACHFDMRVLVIDSDDQANATKALGVRDKFHREHQTLWSAFINRRNFRDVMVPSSYPNLYVIPATKELRKAQLAFGQSARGIKLFRRLLEGIEEDFDFVLIDTKPQINIMLQAALAASAWYLIPSFPESDSYDGFVDLVAECEEIQIEENPRLNCLGLFFTCVKRIAAHAAYMDFVIKLLSDADIPVFPAHIRASNTIATGGLQNIPASSLASAKNVKEDYKTICAYILSEMKENAQGRPRIRPNLHKLGVLEDQMAPGHKFDLTPEVHQEPSLFA